MIHFAAAVLFLVFDLQLGVELGFSMVELNPYLWYQKHAKTTKLSIKFN